MEMIKFAEEMGDVRKIELLAPARDASTAIEALKHGADAVYMGATSHGARAQAGNAIDDIRRVVDYAHRFAARVYVTVNTLVYDDEIAAVERMVRELYDARVDALIVQDMSLLRMNLPPIALHASTQCDIRTPEKARFLEQVGFSQLVLARELTLNEIAEIRRETTVPLEAFVHGALCVSYSGRCQISEALYHRSANRGECAQVCRYAFDLEDENGNVLLKDKHLLSLRDLNRSEDVERMIDAGVSSFKIEGRLKDTAYVKNVVAYYRRRLDEIIGGRDDLERASAGTTELTFEPCLEKSFNRGFTQYFLDERRPRNGQKMASIDTPKSRGEAVGEVEKVIGAQVVAKAECEFHNGDGLMFAAADGTMVGARVNEAAGRTLRMRAPIDIKPGAKIFRNFDKKFCDILAKESAVRWIGVRMKLECNGSGLCLTATDEMGNEASAKLTHNETFQNAKRNQSERQREELGKLGNTIYRLTQCDVVGDKFVPVSMISQLRHEVVEKLGAVQTENYNAAERRPEDCLAKYPSEALESQDNVANSMAREFYADHGVKEFAKAIETEVAPRLADRVLMHTRYCLRRELGMCLKERGGNAYRGKLYLVAGERRFEVKTDCEMCEMRIIPNRSLHR